MSYALRKDSLGFRAIASRDDVGSDEVFSKTQPVIVPTYRELRKPLYPPDGDGLDAMVKGGQALEDYKAACLAVKALIPKP